MGNPALTYSILNGPPAPVIECLGEGKKIATVIVDCTLMTPQNTGDSSFDIGTDTVAGFPEWQTIRQFLNTNSAGYFGYLMQEFDLSNLVNGQGLDQVLACMCYARPQYGGFVNSSPPPPNIGVNTDFATPTTSGVSPALITNTSTLQTVPLLTVADTYYSGYGYTSFQSFPFIGGKHTRVRFFKPVSLAELTAGQTYGKFQLQFTNFPLPAVNMPTFF